MKADKVLKLAYAMPLIPPCYRRGRYRFVDRQFPIVSYRAGSDKLRAVIPAPLDFTEPIVEFEFIRMSDPTGFGDCTEAGQVIPVSLHGTSGG
jgi:acetoacetate decarboxylase